MNQPARRPELDPDASRFLAKLKAAGLPPIDQIPLHQARMGSASTVVTADPVGQVDDHTITSDGQPLKVRIYRPESATGGAPGDRFLPWRRMGVRIARFT